MFDNLVRLTKKCVLLEAKYKLQYSAESLNITSGFFECNTAADAEKFQNQYRVKRERFMKKLNGVRNKITTRLKKSYNYDGLDDAGKQDADLKIMGYFDDIENKANDIVTEGKNKGKSR